jgi:multidrug resistance efflux pump
MSTASEPIVPRPRPAPPRLSILPEPPPTPPAPQLAPWRRMAVLVGAATVVIVALAAYKVLSLGGNSPGDPKLNGDSIGVPASARVFCNGVADVDGGMLNLTATQMGDVVAIPVKEGQVVKENDVLFQVNDEPAKIAVTSAELLVKNAEAKLAQARQGWDQFNLGLQEQQKAIDASQNQLAAAESMLKRLENLKKSDLTNENELNAKRREVDALRDGVEAAKIKYRRIKAANPEELVNEAQTGIGVANERLHGEKLKLDHCTLRAPSDGTVVRINVAKGALISPQMQQPPIVFCPTGTRIIRAEILPEFASRVQEGMEATIKDESNPKISWTGKVSRLSDAYMRPRRPNEGGGMISLNGGESNSLEAIVELTSTNTPPRIGQRVRVEIGPKQ